MQWLYTLAAANPRIARMYMYQWAGNPSYPFDSGLVGAEGTPRAAYFVVASEVGMRPAAAAPARGTTVAAAPPASAPSGVPAASIPTVIRFSGRDPVGAGAQP